eukprot:TRINITY_DN4603_c0_g1_i5.p1 TRINITY_DN4603_c0_g1~~TRINITY_DN4603_c0_g1_i5.p1  ORF type:complete len:428 (+),score=58.27 TRINITY_DN4603_c0_g1_i5:104-1387(+)
MESESAVNFDQLLSFPCPIHKKRKLEYVCGQKEIQKRLLCSECLLDHKGDLKQVSNIDEFMEKCLLYPSLKEQKGETISMYETRFTERMMLIFENLDQLCIDFNNEVNKVKTRIQEELDQRRTDLSNKIDELSRARHVLNVPREIPSFESKEQFSEYLDKQLLIIEREKAILRPLHSIYGAIKRDYLNREIYHSFELFHAKARSFIDGFQKAFPSEAVSHSPQPDLTWSVDLKPAHLTVDLGDKRITCSQQMGTYGIGFVDLNLAEIKGPISWYVKLEGTRNVASGSGFGIGSLKRAKMSNFLNFTGTDGQGFNLLMDSVYMITDVPAGNRMLKKSMSGPLLKKGEVIKITYDPEMRKLSFNWGDEKREITDIEEKSDDPYYPVFVVYYQNEALKIVSSDEYKGQDQVFAYNLISHKWSCDSLYLHS